MNTVNVVLTKEALDPQRGDGEIAVVLDVIFATSSISAALQAGARRVVPAMDLDDAEQLAGKCHPGSWVLAGERDANPFSGYRSYHPLALSTPDINGLDLIYATTNGTVALRRCHAFAAVYTACLRNASAVARHLLAHRTPEQNIVIVCSGSRGRFSLEDFYGAGYFVACLQRLAPAGSLRFSDTAVAASLAFRDSDPYQVMCDSRLGQVMLSRNMQDDLRYISRLDCIDQVSVYRDGAVVTVDPADAGFSHAQPFDLEQFR